MIVDAHAHLGFDHVFDHDFTEADLVEGQERDGIGLSLVQPATAHDLETVQHYHNAIADLARRLPGRFRGIANPNPHLPGDAYEREVRRCTEELGFAGIKVHPAAHAVNPLGRDGRRAFALADSLGVPAIVHTGSGLPWAAPALLEPIATAHPHLRLVVAHAGAMFMAAEAALLAERHANVYLECTWTAGFLVREWVRRLGAHRVLFGSDHADNAATELAKFRTAGLTAEELDWTLGRTAATVFGLTDREREG